MHVFIDRRFCNRKLLLLRKKVKGTKFSILELPLVKTALLFNRNIETLKITYWAASRARDRNTLETILPELVLLLRNNPSDQNDKLLEHINKNENCLRLYKLNRTSGGINKFKSIVINILLKIQNRLKAWGLGSLELSIAKLALRVDENEKTLRCVYWPAHRERDIETLFAIVPKLENILEQNMSRANKATMQKIRSSRLYPIILKRQIDNQAGLTDFLIQGNLERIEQYIDELSGTDKGKARIFTELAKLLRMRNPQRALEYGIKACELDPAPFRLKWLAILYYDAGWITKAREQIDTLPNETTYSPSEYRKVQHILNKHSLLHRYPALPSPKGSYQGNPDNVLYIAASTLPYLITGYTNRTQCILEQLTSAGENITCLMRPGYPYDRISKLNDAQRNTDEIVINGVCYKQAINAPGRYDLEPELWQEKTSETICNFIEELNIGIVHAASDHENAIPALIAARKMGLPFIYEMRGLWELSTASKRTNWESTERYFQAELMERYITRNADHVITITDVLADEIESWGIDTKRISVAKNAVNSENFTPRKKDPVLSKKLSLKNSSFVIVYAGSLLQYEGIEDIIKAIKIVSCTNIDIRLVLVGDGEYKANLMELCKILNLINKVKFINSVPQSRIPDYLSLADVTVIARKPHKVCQLISPMKPAESMAMGIPVIASDLPALREVVQHERTGLLYTPGNIDELADNLVRLATNKYFYKTLSTNCREYVVRERTWSSSVNKILDVYNHFRNTASINNSNFL